MADGLILFAETFGDDQRDPLLTSVAFGQAVNQSLVVGCRFIDRSRQEFAANGDDMLLIRIDERRANAYAPACG